MANGRFVSFVSGSVAAILALLAIYDQELLLKLHITQEGTLVFYLGLFGTIFAIARGMVPDENIVFEPENRLLQVVHDTHYLPEEWKDRLSTDEVRRSFAKIFVLKVQLLTHEILSVFFTPIVMWFSLTAVSDILL